MAKVPTPEYNELQRYSPTSHRFNRNSLPPPLCAFAEISNRFAPCLPPLYSENCLCRFREYLERGDRTHHRVPLLSQPDAEDLLRLVRGR